MGQIVIHGLAVLLDDQDVELVSGWTWHLHRSRWTTYLRGFPKGLHGRKRGQRYMHRLLTGAENGRQVDHANGCGWDNRRENLRICSASQNAANRRGNSGQSYKGVHFDARTGRWRSELRFEHTRHRLGRFDTAEEAAAAYARKAVEVCGEFANSSCGAKL